MAMDVDPARSHETVHGQPEDHPGAPLA
jgi:hypothetical protein